jgi:Fe-S cluster assembly iron-binding protein IscA
MLQVTERALDILEELRDASQAGDGEGILLYRETDGSLNLAVATPGAGDQIFSRDGRVIIIVSEDLSQPLDGLVLDFVEGADGGGLMFERRQTA